MEDNEGIPEQDEEVKEQEKKAKEDALYSKVCVTDVMSIKTGRDFVWELLTDCGVYQDGFNADPYVHARNAGRKSAGLQILHKILSACPDKHELMFAEHKYKEKE